ncbi:hypothetical protein QVD17_31245 [Tagetes erecta]|uniref:Uncharacterized protein n=1 Tax=Tagetes erecta TaxID=13708 RepID=A0AAD8K569_TARER|nr:hypothetical protein QVD17_31245 [Tagetes erecta]
MVRFLSENTVLKLCNFFDGKPDSGNGYALQFLSSFKTVMARQHRNLSTGNGANMDRNEKKQGMNFKNLLTHLYENLLNRLMKKKKMFLDFLKRKIATTYWIIAAVIDGYGGLKRFLEKSGLASGLKRFLKLKDLYLHLEMGKNKISATAYILLLLLLLRSDLLHSISIHNFILQLLKSTLSLPSNFIYSSLQIQPINSLLPNLSMSVSDS